MIIQTTLWDVLFTVFTVINSLILVFVIDKPLALFAFFL